MKRSEGVKTKQIKLALLVVSVLAIRGAYAAYENQHIKVIHSSYLLKAVHPLVQERYLELRNVLYTNRNSKDALLSALVKNGALIELDINDLSGTGYASSFDHQVPKVSGAQLSMPDDGAVVITLTNWNSSNWQAELNLAMPFRYGMDLKEVLASLVLGRLPF